MPAQDLPGLVALDAPGAGVPGRDPALGIQLADAVVGDAFDQQAELLLAAAQRLLGSTPLGQVARDLGEAAQRARRVADRVDDDMRPEARAVLAHAPGLRLEPTLGQRRGQGTGGQALGAILLAVEAREMAADDLAGFVALDALGAAVPAHHPALRIEHVDRIVAHALHQQPERACVDLFTRQWGGFRRTRHRHAGVLAGDRPARHHPCPAGRNRVRDWTLCNLGPTSPPRSR